MKKNLWIVFGLLLASGALFGGTITVTQPSGGNVAMGSSCPIAWTATGVSAHVKIQLIRPGGGLVGPLATDLPPGSSPFAWTVAAPAVVGEQYRIRVHAKDGSADGESAIFTVIQGGTPPPPPPPPPPPSAVTLTLGSPNGGESWGLGSEQAINWTSTNLTGKVQLQLYRHPCCFIGVIEENLPSTGSITWKAGEYQGNTAPAGQYNIRVCSMTDPKIFDLSDAPFTIQRLKMDTKKPAPLFLKPDLVVCANAVVYTPLNTPGTFHVHVRNIGGGTAKAPFTVKIELSQNETRLVTVEADLAPGETRWVCDYSASSSHHAGLGFAAVVDPDDAITEANEQNNILHGWLQVGASNPVAFPLSCSDGSPM
jgi:hypothetical protein